MPYVNDFLTHKWNYFDLSYIFSLSKCNLKILKTSTTKMKNIQDHDENEKLIWTKATKSVKEKWGCEEGRIEAGSICERFRRRESRSNGVKKKIGMW